jgi:hypothetical protein
MNLIKKRLIRKASTYFVTATGEKEEVKNTQLLSMLNDGRNAIEVLEDCEVYETIDEVTGLFNSCYHVDINRFEGQKHENLWTGYVATYIVADIQNGEYDIVNE